MLISYPKSAIGTRIKESCAPGNDGKLSTFGARLDQLLDAGAAAEVAPSRDENKRVLKLSTNARTLLREFHLAVETAQKSGGQLETVTAFASKAAEQAARIAAVLTLWEDENAQEISAEAMANGVALADYYLSEAKRVVDAGQISENTLIAEKIRVWLLEKWPDLARANGRSSDAFLSSDILRLGPNELRDKGKLKVPLAKLQECGWIIRLPANTEIDGKRRKEAYRIVRA